ncbi:MAG: MATE family efflux transporter [Rikenellaceae bacterium]
MKKRIFVDKSYYKNIFTLALPIILANAGQSVVMIADNVMVGRLGAVPLAAASLAGAIIHIALVFVMGLSLSLTPIVGELFANKNYKKCAVFFENSLSLNVITVLIMTILLSLFIPFFDNIGQAPEVIELTIPFYTFLLFSVIPLVLFFTFKQFMEGIGNTKVSMYITLICNVINIILNYALIYGKLGCPEMGATGAAVSTLISRTLMPILFFGYMYRNIEYKRFFYFFKRTYLKISEHIQLLKIGLPISGQLVVEVSALSFIMVMSGWINPESIAASQIMHSVVSVMFMITVGISGAVTILTSHKFGKKDGAAIRDYTKAGVLMAAVFMCFASIIFLLFAEPIVSIFTTDLEVQKIATRLLILAVFLEVFDGIQVTALGGLRGIKDVSKPMTYAVILYIFVNVPIAYIFGFVLNMETIGIWMGFIVCIGIASILFSRRLFMKARSIRPY